MKPAPYREYKDSGMHWLRKIPGHWDICRNGRLFAQRNETGYGNLPILEVSLKTGVRVRDMDNLKRKQVMSDREKYQRAVQGDMAYNMMRMWQGAVGVAPVDGLVSPAYVVISPFPEVESRYYSYLFRISAYMNEIDGYSRGIVKDRNRLYWQDFKRMPSVFPPLAEQKQIVNFLDAIGGKVWRLIRNKRSLIELLKEQKQNIINEAVTRGINPDVKLKPSGVEWLGEIPEHWEISRLKYLVKANTDVLPENANEDYTFKYLDIGAVGTGIILQSPETIKFKNAPSRARRIVKKGDTIISTVRTYLRAVYYISEEVENLIVSTGFAVLSPIKILPRLLGMLIQCDGFIDQVIKESVGASYPAINVGKLCTLPVAFPESKTEQRFIVDYIDKKCGEIDQTITHTQRQIDLIREYRTRLISDVVTGKVDVRDISIQAVDDLEDIEEPEEIEEDFETEDLADMEEAQDEID